MKFDIALQITPSFVLREYSQATGTTQSELARDLSAVTTQVRRIGQESKTLLDTIARLQAAAANASPAVRAAVSTVAAQASLVASLSGGLDS